MRSRAEILQVGVERCAGAGAFCVGPGLVVGILTRLLVEAGDALARLGDVHSSRETLDVAIECGDSVGAHRLGPSLLVRLLARLLPERRDALARLRHVRSGRVVLDVTVECSDRVSAHRIGPGALVGLLARLLVEPGDALQRLRNVRAGAEILHIGIEPSDGIGAHGLRPGLPSSSLRACSSAADCCCCCAVWLSDGWLQADRRAATAIAARAAQRQTCETCSGLGLAGQISVHGRPLSSSASAPSRFRSTPSHYVSKPRPRQRRGRRELGVKS